MIFLKVLLKLVKELKPHFSAICDSVKVLDSIYFFAILILILFMSSLVEIFIEELSIRFNCLEQIPADAATSSTNMSELMLSDMYWVAALILVSSDTISILSSLFIFGKTLCIGSIRLIMSKISSESCMLILW